MKNVYIYGLAKRTTIESLAQWASRFGLIKTVYIPEKEGKRMNYAFVEMETADQASSLVSEGSDFPLDGAEVQISLASAKNLNTSPKPKSPNMDTRPKRKRIRH